MLYWVFDVDHTLYQLPKDAPFFSYSFLSQDPQLKYLLSTIPCKKLLFTNGTKGHGITTVEKLNVKEKFPDNCIVGRDTLNGLLKPDINAYHEFISLMNIKRNDKVVFFEDTAENLVTAKSLGWITVLIGRKRPMVTDIDFWFTDINQALNYFHNCISKNKH
jgi:putative hydrolase of the HAD superfamily